MQIEQNVRPQPGDLTEAKQYSDTMNPVAFDYIIKQETNY